MNLSKQPYQRSHRSLRSSRQGFTIIELLIATAAFSVVLLILTVALVQIGRLYYKGVNQDNTEQTAESVMNEVARPIQFSGTDPVITKAPVSPHSFALGDSVSSFCIGNLRYSYILDEEVESNVAYNNTKHQIRHALWRDQTTDPAACAPLDLSTIKPSDGTTVPNTGVELLSENMRLSNLVVKALDPPTDSIWKVSAWVVYGDDDLLIKNTDPLYPSPAKDDSCVSTLNGGGGQFCAVSELNTVVQRRLKS